MMMNNSNLIPNLDEPTLAALIVINLAVYVLWCTAPYIIDVASVPVIADTSTIIREIYDISYLQMEQTRLAIETADLAIQNVMQRPSGLSANYIEPFMEDLVASRNFANYLDQLIDINDNIMNMYLNSFMGFIRNPTIGLLTEISNRGHTIHSNSIRLLTHVNTLQDMT